MSEAVVSQDQVVTAWIKAELNSPRFQELFTNEVGTSEMLTAPDRAEERFKFLQTARRRTLADFPWDEVTWHKMTIPSKEALGKFRTCAGLTWLALTEGTRSLIRASQTIAQQPEELDPHSHVKSTGVHIKNGAQLEQIICFSPTTTSPPVILEGHVRALAYFSAGPDSYPIEAFHGTSTGTNLQKFDHGLNLDEVRANFLVNGKEYV